MASQYDHNHHQCSHRFSPQTTTTISSSCCSCTCCCCCTVYPPSHYHHYHPPPISHPHDHIYSPHYTLQSHCQTQYYSYPPAESHHQKPLHPYLRQQDEYEHRKEQQPVVSSLLRRISALESYLLLHRRGRYYSSRISSFSYSLLHDAAARTIQTHFRAFLVRRSQALRYLKRLALIKSTLNSLKSSVSGKIHFDFQAVSRKATALLLEIDSIKGGDPVMRDGKRSISRELVSLIESLERASVKPNDFDLSVKNARLDRNCEKSKRVLCGNQRKLSAQFVASSERELIRSLVGKVDGISGLLVADDEEDDEELKNHNRVSINAKFGPSRGGLARDKAKLRAKQRVRFAENGDAYRTIQSCSELMSDGIHDGRDSLDYDVESSEADLLDHMRGQLEEIGVSSKENEEDGEVQSEDGGRSSQSSDGEVDPRINMMVSGGIRKTMKHDRSEDRRRVLFSAPTPVKMETRSDLINNRSTVKMVT